MTEQDSIKNVLINYYFYIKVGKKINTHFHCYLISFGNEKKQDFCCCIDSYKYCKIDIFKYYYFSSQAKYLLLLPFNQCRGTLTSFVLYGN